MRSSIGCIPIKFINLLISLCLVIVLLYYISGSRLDTLQKSVNIQYHHNYSKCEVMHIGIVWIGYQSNFYLYAMLKSLYKYRSKPLHFHIIVDNVSEKTLKNMFDKWEVPQVTVSFYNVNIVSPYSSLTSKNIKLMFPEIIPTSIARKIIVLSNYLTFVEDIYELWTLFDYFKEKQAIGLVENQNNEYYKRIDSETAIIGKGFNTDVILFNLEVIKTTGWEELLIRAVKETIPVFKDTELTDQNLINAVVSDNFELLYIISCDGNTQIFNNSYNCHNNSKIKVVNWSTPNNFLSHAHNSDYLRSLHGNFQEYNGTCFRTELHDCVAFNRSIQQPTVTGTSNDSCGSFLEASAYHWRTLLFFREFKHNSSEDDVTLVSQLTYDRLPALEKLSERWEGPMSLALFVTDSELHKFLIFVENSKLLQNRYNIAFHAVFKEPYHHPINLCRNVALRNVVTPYVFLNDVDFVPMQGMYKELKKYLNSTKGMEKKVLVVPAFDTNPKSKEIIPATKNEVVKGMNSKYLLQFMKSTFFGGHAPTDYKKWKTAVMPYKIQWKFKYEPYVVGQRNITAYDERFVGYGWDKVSHITKLKAQSYDFEVLSNAFVVHKRHKPAAGKIQLFKTKDYAKCLYKLMMVVVEELNKEYGIKLNLNSSVPL